MKRIFALFLVSALLLSSALADTLSIDLATATDQELLDAKNAIEAELTTRGIDDSAVEYPEGTYTAGTDIPAGEYMVYTDGLGYITIMSETNTLIDFETVTGICVIMFHDGEKIDLSNCRAVPVAQSTFVADLTQSLTGFYKVGFHIPAGDYTITPADGALVSSFSIQSGALNTSAYISAFQILGTAVDIELEDGEYIQMTECMLTAK